VNREAQNFGLAVVDVKIRRADLPEQNSQAIFQRMQTERAREAAELRAQGAEAAQRIRARADRDGQVIVAEANRDAERMRGEGDAERNRIFAEAYSVDPDFFAFYRSMQAYEQGLKGTDTRLLLSPDSEFFRYFTNPNGTGSTGSPPVSAAPVPRTVAPAVAPATPAPPAMGGSDAIGSPPTP
jgi:membrane protease subunit HflC